MMPPNVWTQVGPNNVPLEGSGRKRGIGRLNSIVFIQLMQIFFMLVLLLVDFGNQQMLAKLGVLVLIFLTT